MWEVNGLPAHVLLVHAVVVIIPAASLAVVLAAWSATWRKRLGLLPPLLALASMVLVPITTSAGEWLRDRVGNSGLIREHAELGDTMWVPVLALLVVSVVVHALARRPDPLSPAVRIGVAVLATVVAAGATVQTVRVGESGSRAVWENSF